MALKEQFSNKKDSKLSNFTKISQEDESSDIMTLNSIDNPNKSDKRINHNFKLDLNKLKKNNVDDDELGCEEDLTIVEYELMENESNNVTNESQNKKQSLSKDNSKSRIAKLSDRRKDNLNEKEENDQSNPKNDKNITSTDNLYNNKDKQDQ